MQIVISLHNWWVLWRLLECKIDSDFSILSIRASREIYKTAVKNGLLKENLKMMLSVGSIMLVKSHLKLQYNIQKNIVRHIWI